MPHHSLEYFITVPIIRLFLSIFFPLGILALCDFLIRHKKLLSNEKENYLFLYLTVLFSFCLIIYLYAATFNITPIIPIRFLSYMICTLPFIWIVIFRKKLNFDFKFNVNSLLALTAVALYFLISLAPATDADSLGYHLAIPLSILQGIELSTITMWNHQFLIGLGDYINLIGLSIGTDCLGATTQFLAFILFLSLFMGKNKFDKYFYVLIALSPFLLIFLLSSQKNQLFGEIAVVLSFIFFKKDRESLKPIILIFIACGIKLSFYISGGSLLLFYFFQSEKKLKYLYRSVLSYCLYLLPFHIFNFINYQTPIPPFLNFLIADHEARTIMEIFKTHLQTYTEGFSLPLGLIVPSSLGTLTTTFGPSALIVTILLFFSRINKDKILLIILVLISALLAQKTPRFFLTYYFLATWILLQSSNQLKTSILKFSYLFIRMQVFVLLLGLGYGASQLFPGALTNKLRNIVLSKNAYMYPQISWANEHIPSNTLYINTFRSNTWINRPFITQDFFYYLKFAPKLLIKSLENNIAARNSATWHILLSTPIQDSSPLYPFLSKNPIASKEFERHTRNPFSNERTTKNYHIYTIEGHAFLKSLKNSLDPRN